MKNILLLALLISATGFSQNTLNVLVENVKNSDGNIAVAVYNKEDAFLEFDQAYTFANEKAQQGKTTVAIKDLPNGEYALAIFHDENGNDELDTNWMGIPKEKVGFSIGKLKTFGPPKYKECVFEVTSDRDIEIPLEN